MMDDDERDQQQRLHEAIETVLTEHGDLEDGLLLTGWVVVFETASLSDHATAHAGHLYGPREMTTWRARGLLDWTQRFCLVPDKES